MRLNLNLRQRWVRDVEPQGKALRGLTPRRQDRTLSGTCTLSRVCKTTMNMNVHPARRVVQPQIVQVNLDVRAFIVFPLGEALALIARIGRFWGRREEVWARD